ncbi:MAG TPA: hypothetical protein VIN59_05410 [Alphaproteobacteria bacterium]
MQLTAENKDFFLEKLFSYGIAGLVCLFLPPMGVGNTYVVLGLAHYAMTALYQYKANRLTPPKLLKSAILIAVLYTVGFYYPKHFTVFAAAFLLLHVFTGEIRHFKRAYTFPYFILTACLAILLSSWLALELWSQIPIDMAVEIGILTPLVLFGAYRYFTHVDIRRMDAFFPVLLIFYIVFVGMEYFGVRPYAVQAFGFITIAHFLTTYFNVFLRFRTKATAKARIFAVESVLMNLLMLGGFLLAVFVLGPESDLFQYVYHPISFYVWTITHFITTWNNDDYEYIFQDSAPDGRPISDMAPAKA